MANFISLTTMYFILFIPVANCNQEILPWLLVFEAFVYNILTCVE
jgi:hypothetical protein